METINNLIGNWPPDIEQAEKDRRIMHIRPEDALTVIHGKDNETKCVFFVSNKNCHMGKFEICPGKYTDPEMHKGDEILMVLQGGVQIIIWDELRDTDEVARISYNLKQGQRFLIPEGFKHQYFNLETDSMAEFLFTVAPNL